METLAAETAEAVLDRLGFTRPPVADRAGLDAVYLAWCRTVPFDNLIKRIDIADGTTPFRNDTPEPFFALFLEHGTGGTCWPSTRALAALLRTLDFDVRLGSAAMADDFAGRNHTHGTILAAVDDDLLWVDTSMLTDAPVPLIRGIETRVDHALRPVRVEPVDGLWRVHWVPGAGPETMGCLLLATEVDGEHYSDRYEWSRQWSPFNTSVYATSNRADRVVTVAMGRRILTDAMGRHVGEPHDTDGRMRVLVEEFGYSQEIVDLLPPDDPSG
jgi:N-hydroxyarylamine O-acetyltransferase